METTFVEHFWISVLMAAGWIVISYAVRHAFRRRRIPRNRLDWADELERRACEAMRAAVHAAEAQRDLVEMAGEIPQDFDPMIFMGCRVADGLQRTILIEAEREGLCPVGTVERVYGIRVKSLGDDVAPLQDTVAPPSPPPAYDDATTEEPHVLYELDAETGERVLVPRAAARR